MRVSITADLYSRTVGWPVGSHTCDPGMKRDLGLPNRTASLPLAPRVAVSGVFNVAVTWVMLRHGPHDSADCFQKRYITSCISARYGGLRGSHIESD